jgi:hypothetical protein
VKDEKGEYLTKSKEFAEKLRLRHDDRCCDLSALENLIKKVKELAASTQS